MPKTETVITASEQLNTAPVSSQSLTEAQAKAYIYQHESGDNPSAVNPYSGACGLGQALPCNKMGCDLSDYVCQDTYFTGYMLARYGSWIAAQQFWINNKYW